jgi:hypothetical protein
VARTSAAEPARALPVVAADPHPPALLPRRLEAPTSPTGAGPTLFEAAHATPGSAWPTEVVQRTGPAPTSTLVAPHDPTPAGTDALAARSGFTEVALPVAAAPVVQRATEAEPEPPAAEPPAAPGAPATVASVAATAAPGTPAAAPNLDELARRLYEPLSARLRAELWLDRERTGRSMTR